MIRPNVKRIAPPIKKSDSVQLTSLLICMPIKGTRRSRAVTPPTSEIDFLESVIIGCFTR